MLDKDILHLERRKNDYAIDNKNNYSDNRDCTKFV